MRPGLPMFYYDIAVLLRFGSSENQNYKTDIPDVCETEENSSANTVVGPYTQPHTHMKIRDFAHGDPGGCLKDPRQQNTKV